MKISLPDQMKQWVMSRVEVGLYPDASAYVCELIRRDQEHTTRLAHQQALIDQAIVTGESNVTISDIIARVQRRKRG